MLARSILIRTFLKVFFCLRPRLARERYEYVCVDYKEIEERRYGSEYVESNEKILYLSSCRA